MNASEFFITVISSSAISGLLSAGLIWLSKTWISERLKGAIKDEYDTKLESHKAQLKSEADVELEKLKSVLGQYRVQFAAERVARELLMDGRWRLRTFDIIKHHLGGFSDDDLRQILVRAGAIRFQSKEGKELWGLLERNSDRLGVDKVDVEIEHRPSPSSPNEVTTQDFKF
jgi:hypothetical protein